MNFKRNFFGYGEVIGKVLFQEESESEELVSYLLKKYIEYEVQSCKTVLKKMRCEIVTRNCVGL